MKIIINGDDLCLNQPATDGIIEAFKKGYIDQTTVLISSPKNLKYALEILHKENLMDRVGLHFALTYGTVYTDEMKHCKAFCRDGRFLEEFAFNNRRRLFLTKKEKEAAIKELTYQVKLFKESGFTLMHADSHGHIHVYPSINKMIIKIAKDNGFVSMRLSLNMHSNKKDNIRKNNVNKRIFENFKTTKYCCSADEFCNAKKDENGIYEIMVHPVIRDGKLINKGSKIAFEELMKNIGNTQRITYKEL